MADAMKLEDVLFFKLKDLILEQSEGEWTDDMIVRDAHHFANNLRPLLAASPPAREEAPAEGAGGKQLDRLFYGGGEYVRADEAVRQIMALQAEIAALRNRTSEPEAGEAWGFGWVYDSCGGAEIGKMVVTKTAEANTFLRNVCAAGPVALYTHPAPATADKLRVVVEALEKIERWFGEFPETGRNWPNEDGSDSDRPMSYGAVNGSNGERDFMRHVARKALAILQEQPQ